MLRSASCLWHVIYSTHFRLVRVVLVFKPSASARAPSAAILLKLRLLMGEQLAALMSVTVCFLHAVCYLHNKTYYRLVSAVLVFKASASTSAPSEPMLLLRRLLKGVSKFDICHHFMQEVI